MTSEKWTSDSTIYLTPGQGDAWAKQAQATSRTGTQRILHSGHTPARADVAAALGVAPGAAVILRRRLILADDQPVEIADSYYPATIADGTALAAPGKIPGGAVTLLDQLGYLASDVREDIHARHPTEEEITILHLPPTAPVLVLTRLSLTADGTPFEYAAMTMSAGQHLRYQMQTGVNQ